MNEFNELLLLKSKSFLIYVISLKDSVISGVLSSLIVAYILTFFKNSVNRRGSRDGKEFKLIPIKEYETVEVGSRKEENNDIFLLVFIMIIGTLFFNQYKKDVVEVLNWVVLVGFSFNMFLFIREFKSSSVEHLKSRLFWTSIIWGYSFFALYLLKNPIYITNQAIVMEQSIKVGKGLIFSDIEGLLYLIYQFIGVLFLFFIILYSIGMQIYTLIIWWNLGQINVNNSFFQSRFFGRLNSMYYKRSKFLIVFIIFVIGSFFLLSGFLFEWLSNRTAVNIIH
ncbi:hypothetical protein [Orenia marismortui]|uniref:hypothetical protein n=1 Tax=Orenia marismortui TaxID=46469 RepID=UPI00036A3F72|nr:hypothetical protein [Orenia marismortui]